MKAFLYSLVAALVVVVSAVAQDTSSVVAVEHTVSASSRVNAMIFEKLAFKVQNSPLVEDDFSVEGKKMVFLAGYMDCFPSFVFDGKVDRVTRITLDEKNQALRFGFLTAGDYVIRVNNPLFAKDRQMLLLGIAILEVSETVRDFQKKVAL